eukprot:768522-Hanusia_phi.AAC.11
MLLVGGLADWLHARFRVVFGQRVGSMLPGASGPDVADSFGSDAVLSCEGQALRGRAPRLVSWEEGADLEDLTGDAIVDASSTLVSECHGAVRREPGRSAFVIQVRGWLDKTRRFEMLTGSSVGLSDFPRTSVHIPQGGWQSNQKMRYISCGFMTHLPQSEQISLLSDRFLPRQLGRFKKVNF